MGGKRGKYLKVTSKLLYESERFPHGLINNIDTKPKCRHLKKFTVKDGRCFSEFIDWRYRKSCWYFDPAL